MGHPTEYAKAMAQLPESPEAVCNWFQQRWDFEGLPEVNQIIDQTLSKFKESARSKFPTVQEYLKMAEARFQSDVSMFMPGQVGYFFNCDGTGNFSDSPPPQTPWTNKTK